MSDLDRMFNTFKAKLSDEHGRCKEELQKFLEKEIHKLEEEESELTGDLAKNQIERSRMEELLQKIEKDKKHEGEFEITDLINLRKHEQPRVIEFPVLMMPIASMESCVEICHKVNPKICFFGEKKKILTLCPLTGVYSLTTISNNYEIQYYASACTLPTGEIFITGGGSSNNCFLYSSREPNLVEKKKKMISARKEHSCVYLNGKIFVISGYDGKTKGMAGC